MSQFAAKTAAPIGASFTFLALVTGSLWGRPMWGTYWEWDARLTSVLILFLMYLGLIALWRAVEDPSRAARAAAVLTLVGAINLPIIKFSVDWWNTLHQPSSVLRMGGPALDRAFLIPLLVMAGAFSLLFLTPDALVAARDPWGFRPLVIGRLDEAVVVASETCALDLIDARYVRDVEPGEVVVIDRDGLRSFHPFPPEPVRQCIFEHVYFARPDSLVFGRNVLATRAAMGRQLAREAPADADIVVPVPDSGMGAALGYAEESGLPFQWGLIRNHYVGRTFIEPRQKVRSFGVKIKLNPVRSVLEGKRVVLIDDSIVRGTTSRQIIQMAREAGARKVYFASAAPPVRHPNIYGIDMPVTAELVAHGRTVQEIEAILGADRLIFQDLDDLIWAVRDGNEDLVEFDARRR